MGEMVSFVKDLYKRVMDDDVFGLGAQLAYFFLLSLFPFLLFVMTLIGYLPIEEDYLMDFIETYAPTEIMDLIQSNIHQLVNDQNTGLLSIGIIGTLWPASNAINAIIRALNKAYNVKENRSFIVARLIAIVLTIVMVVVICIALLLPVFGRMIGIYLFSFVGLSDDFLQAWEMLRWIIFSVISFIALVALYRLAPNKRIRIKNVLGGAIFATLSWQLISFAFSFYINTIGNYSATYGSLGAVIILMIWFYIFAIIIIIGGIINAMTRERKTQKR
ncbi:YihY/virulence factor BrkB family protein [Oceanobacillus halotolerans]|uniref:YihY/virulence factor BrkB family protein n=1 Tax=Oceanobacillus halotolerans TaxID=2663380 RepID=UPI0013DB9C32|nr:YihY/virulence factor BrkB family protein [Oceanobacillus halotolerans]